MTRQILGMKVSGFALQHPHVVQVVSFSKQWPSDDAPVECSCGHSCVVRDWPEHAKGLTVQRPWSDRGPGKTMEWSGPTHDIPATRVPAL